MVLGGWFLGCYSLVAYRLKSDDLELMEREVYEELQKKKEVERFIQKQKVSGQGGQREAPVGVTEQVEAILNQKPS